MHKLILPDLTYRLLPSTYLKIQSEALRAKQEVRFDEEFDGVAFYNDIIFNEKGNVNQAQTISSNQLQIVVELGMGRLVEK